MEYTDVTRTFLKEKDKSNELIKEVRYYNDSCFIIISKILNQKNLNQDIDTIKFITAGSIQAKIESLDFPQKLRWNLYLIFLFEGDIDSEFKKKIESDKYCCKKYVFKYENNSDFEEGLQKTLPIFIDLDSFLIQNSSNPQNDFFSKEISFELRDEIEKVTFETFIKKKISLEEIIKIYKKEV